MMSNVKQLIVCNNICPRKQNVESENQNIISKIPNEQIDELRSFVSMSAAELFGEIKRIAEVVEKKANDVVTSKSSLEREIIDLSKGVC